MSTLEHSADLPALDQLGDRLEQAMFSAERTPALRISRRRGWRSVAIAVALFVLLAGTAAAATLLVLRGSVIPAPAKVDLQPSMIVQPGTAKLAGVTAKDPRSDTTWTVRVAKSQTGLICLTAGELQAGSFGITGLDNRFRTLAPGFADGCGQAGPNRSAFVGSRVFDSAKKSDVRTVVDGYGGADLKKATLTTVDGPKELPVSDGGVFLGVVRGYPEDSALQVNLAFADGSTETHDFGTGAFIAPDAGGAIRIEAGQIAGYNSLTCVRIGSARQVTPFFNGPEICGSRHADFFFSTRRFMKGERGGRSFGSWNWQHPSRTVVFGHMRGTVTSLSIEGGGGTRKIPESVNGAFQAVYPASVDPKDLTVVARLRNGAVVRKQVEFALEPIPRLGITR